MYYSWLKAHVIRNKVKFILLILQTDFSMQRLFSFITSFLICIVSLYASDVNECEMPIRNWRADRCRSPLVSSEDMRAVLPDSIVAPVLKPETGNSFIAKIIKYFSESNRERHSRGFDISFIGGPYYSSDTKFGIGLVAAGLYRTSEKDSLLPPSEISLYLKATTSMFFQLGVRGNHIAPQDRTRLSYDINFASIATKFWGIGYDNNVNDDNEAKFKYLNSTALMSYVWRVAPKFYIGPMVSFDYVNGRDFHKEWLWHGENDRTFNLGIGFTVQFDSRDMLSNAFQGVYFRFDQRFHPRFMFNKYAFSLSELTFATYHPLWRDAILAGQFHTRITYGNTPWGLLSSFGGSDNMRGYFEGRYRDKSEFDVCVELRQHIWHRNGLVAWVGAGMVFPRFSAMRWRMLLPNYGIGYRWEFKKRVNVRLDFGFGRNQTGFIFSINEAF